MSVLHTDKPYAMKDRAEHAIDRFAALEKPRQADLNGVLVQAQVQHGIEAYRARGKGMDILERETEKHDSAKMAQRLSRIADALQNQAFPPYVMNREGEELPA